LSSALLHIEVGVSIIIRDRKHFVFHDQRKFSSLEKSIGSPGWRFEL